jgi:hypothetical protein
MIGTLGPVRSIDSSVRVPKSGLSAYSRMWEGYTEALKDLTTVCITENH